MRSSKFTDEQIAFALRQTETGTSVKEVIRKMGVSEQTFYRWKKKYSGMMPSDLRRLKQLEEENRQQIALRMRIREIASVRVRYGYKRIHVLLNREGWKVNHNAYTAFIVKKG